MQTKLSFRVYGLECAEEVAPIGAVGNFLSALVGSVGPLMAPFFLAFGLVKWAYIGTEALTAVVMHVTKLGMYGGTDVLTTNSVAHGLLIGGVLIVGSYFGSGSWTGCPSGCSPS